MSKESFPPHDDFERRREEAADDRRTSGGFHRDIPTEKPEEEVTEKQPSGNRKKSSRGTRRRYHTARRSGPMNEENRLLGLAAIRSIRAEKLGDQQEPTNDQDGDEDDYEGSLPLEEWHEPASDSLTGDPLVSVEGGEVRIPRDLLLGGDRASQENEEEVQG